MSCLMGSHGVILAAAMAVSGTVVFLVLYRQRPAPPAVSAAAAASAGEARPPGSLRPCISDAKEGERKKKRKKKRVHFAEQVVELRAEGGNAEEEGEGGGGGPLWEEAGVRRGWSECGRQARGEMPANRVALYSGILRDRHHRMACSY